MLKTDQQSNVGPTQKAVILITVATIFFVGHFFVAGQKLNPTDDNLFFYYSALKHLDTQSIAVDDRRIEDAQERLGAIQEIKDRYHYRSVYTTNYGIQLLTFSYFIESLPLDETGGLQKKMAAVFELGFHWSSFFALVVLLIAFLFVHDYRLYLALLLSVTWQFLFDAGILQFVSIGLLGSEIPEGNPMLVRADNFPIALANHFFFPNYGFSTFSFLPKPHVALILCGVFALRWSGNLKLSYAFAMSTMAFHQSMGFMMLVYIVALDIFKRPAIFKEVFLLVLLTAALALQVARERLWGFIEAEYLAYFALVICILLALAYILINTGYLARFDRLVRTIRSSYLTRVFDPSGRAWDVASDLFLILAIWCLTIIYPVVLNVVYSGNAIEYFWGHVHGRIIAALRPTIWLGLAFIIIQYASQRNLLKRSLSVISLVAISSTVYIATNIEDPKPRVVQQLNVLDDHPVPLKSITGESEALIYFAIAKKAAFGRDYVADLFSKEGN